MGLYINGKRLSELPVPTDWELDDELTGLKDAYNANITLGRLSEIIQADIDDVTPLPPATFAKVMYYTGTNWGASQTFVTDGNVVGIGLAAPTGNHQLELKGDDTKDTVILSYITDEFDTTQKLMSYTKWGIMFITDSGIYENINTETNAGTYGLFVESGIVSAGHVYFDDNSYARFGTINGTSGVFTESANIGYNSGLKIKSDTIQTLDNANFVYQEFTKSGTIRTSNSMFFKIQTWQNTSVSQSGGIVISSNQITSVAPDSSIKSSLHIGGNDAGNENMLTISLDGNITGHDDTQIVLQIDKNGKWFGRFPTSVGDGPSGALLQLYNDGGILKLG